MLETVLKIHMGKRFASTRRGLRNATSAICVIRHGDGTYMHGVGILYPDIEHLYFAEDKTSDPVKLWRDMHVATKIACLSDEILAVAVAIADESVPIDDPRFAKAAGCLMYGYDVAKLRAEVFAKEHHPDDIQKIVLGFKFLHAPIDDPFAKVVKKEVSPSWEALPRVIGTEMSIAI